MKFAPHKLILSISAFLAICAVCFPSLTHAVPGWFDYLGKTYHTGIDSKAASKAPKWQIGKEEPPIGANKAYTLVKPKIDASFGKKVKLKLAGITLVPIGDGISVWAVDFIEVRSEAEVEKALSDESSELSEIIEIRYYVLMDGSVEVPQVVEE